MTMSPNMSKWTFLYLLSCLVMNPPPVAPTHGHQQFPCWYIFGDSMFDNGNNNDLDSLAKANSPPYGIDYPGHVATGRFSNGKNVPDYMAKFLGFKSPIPPNAKTADSDGIHGVNYASASSGILNKSGENYRQVIPLDAQLQNHKARITRLRAVYGNQIVDENLKKCLYSVNTGTNDYIQNYFLKGSISRKKYTPKKYAKMLTQLYSDRLKTLYSFGARTVVVFGTLPSGCTPQEILRHGNFASGCVDIINDALKLFNSILKLVIRRLNNNKDLPGARLCYIDTNSFVDPSVLRSLGIKITSTPCCASSNITGVCIAGQVPCSCRAQYLYWDGYHTTEIIAGYIATRMYSDLSRCLISF